MNFKGTAKRLDDIDLPKLGAILGVGEDELHAFIDVETRGSGFDEQRRPRILCERHKFYKYLPASKRAKAVNAGLANKTPGGYGKEADQYGKLAKMIEIDEHAALLSCSWGLGQIMGFNHKLAGYDTVKAMIEDFKEDEEYHLQAAVTFILKTKLDDELRAHNWAGFAKGYNGENYKINQYDVRLRDAYAKWSRIKDTPWSPVDVAKPETVTIPVPEAATETEIVISPKVSPQPITPSKTGWASIGAILLAIATALYEFFGG
jgi:hypothetical protein